MPLFAVAGMQVGDAVLSGVHVDDDAVEGGKPRHPVNLLSTCDSNRLGAPFRMPDRGAVGTASVCPLGASNRTEDVVVVVHGSGDPRPLRLDGPP